MSSAITDQDYQRKYSGYQFKGQRGGEEIILLLRRHWLVLLFKFFPLIFILIGIVILHILASGVIGFLNLGIDMLFIRLAESFLFMIFWVAFFIVWIDYYLDVWIVTTQRIINIEQAGLFSRQISELEHSKIQDVTSEVKGLIPTLFQHGYVYVQTAGEKARFTFKQVPDPVKVRNIIMQLQKRAILERKREEGEIMRGKL